MFSGGDSSGDGVNSRNQFNWQMTSQTSCNVNPGGSIDWASLAQQWIQMKDSGAGIPDTPPPPIISANNNFKQIKSIKFDEEGEADMEVEKDDELQITSSFCPNTPPPATNTLNANHWVPPPHQDPGVYCTPQPATWSWPARVALPPPILHVPVLTGSLTPPIVKDVLSTTPPLQGITKVPNEAASLLPDKNSLESQPMDAAKRKILPAWIREGLEKMEREKLKQMERETKDNDSHSAGTAAHDSEINNIKSMVKSSTTEMEGESSGNEEANDTADIVASYDDTNPDTTIVASVNSSMSIQQEHIDSGKTYEERISDMMIGVRRTLTELLLEVTNEEIISIAQEALRRRRAKASSAQVIRKSALPSITGKLGLEAYADSDSDNSESDNDTTHDESKRSDGDYDSEEDLKANIRIRQRSFAKTIAEIEDKIEANALREEKLIKEHQKKEIIQNENKNDYEESPIQYKTTISFDKEIGEPLQPDKKSNSNGKRRKERTSRFSDNKDSKNRVTASYFPPPSLGSGSLPTPIMPGSSMILPPSSLNATKYKPSGVGISSTLASPLQNDTRASSVSSSNAHKSSKSSKSESSSRHRRSDSSSTSSSSDSSSSSTESSHSRRSKYSDSRHRPSSRERSKRSNRSRSHRSSRRRDSSDSNDDDHYKKRSSHRRPHKSSHSSSSYSRRHERRRSDSRSSRSRTRSRSRSRSSTTHSSRRKGGRY